MRSVARKQPPSTMRSEMPDPAIDPPSWCRFRHNQSRATQMLAIGAYSGWLFHHRLHWVGFVGGASQGRSAGRLKISAATHKVLYRNDQRIRKRLIWSGLRATSVNAMLFHCNFVALLLLPFAGEFGLSEANY